MIRMTSSIRNDLFLAPSGTCQFWFNRRTLSQSSGSSWKMFAATRISSSDDQYNLIGWAIQFHPMIITLTIWSDYQYHQSDQMVYTLFAWSIHWQLDQMINMLEIWSDDQYIGNLNQLPQIVMWFTTGQDVSTSDLNGEIFYDSILSYHDVWYIIMWWRYRIESICDKNYEQSSIHWKHLLPMIK